MTSTDLLRRLFRGGIAALLIKIGAAGFQFLMFLLLARSMSVDDYGLLGFGFSLATLLAVAGSFGQRMLSLRFLPIYNTEGKAALATGLLRNGALVVTLGTLSCCAVAVWGLFTFKPTLTLGFLLLTGGLALTLAWAEYFASALRAYGSVILALGPRDVLWRVLVILATLPVAFGIYSQLSANGSMILLIGFLAGSVVVQTLLHSATRPYALFRAPAQYDRATWRQAAWGLWGVSVVQIAAPNLTIVILGLLLTPEETGPVFAALRIALLLNLFLLAANMVAAPVISRLFHTGQLDALQRTCTAIALLASAMAGVILVGLAFYGDWLLGLFGEEFGSGYAVLMIVAGAYVVNTLTGPTSVLLELTGHERAAFRLLMTMNALSMAAMVPMTLAFGSVGAAWCLALSIAGWNIQAVLYARREIGIDPSVMGLFYKGKNA